MSGRPNLDMLGQELRRGEVDYGPLDGTEVLPIFSGPGQPGRPHEGRKRLADIGYGSGSGAGINGVAALRGLQVTVGQILHLNYHTTPGDLGGGYFVGKQGANMLWWQGDHYRDDDGMVIVPPGGINDVAWFRIWDHVTAHVGWFGAKCDPTPPTGGLGVDDYIPVQKCFDLFTSGRSAGGAYGGGTLSSGVIDVGPGFSFSKPLIYGGANHGSIRLKGHSSTGRGGLSQACCA